MAELAAGAVSSLLGVLRNEALLLGRVGHDVEFIKEEMESMNSFLEHLARMTPPGGEHDEQVRTWMKQVRDLAHDCSNCIDRYLQRGDPAIHRARSGLRRYASWAYWLVQEMLAQHVAAVRLRELKERARDVGNRRMRYGVELPARPGALAGREYKEGGGTDDDDDHSRSTAAVAADSSDDRRGALEPCTLEDYCTKKLGEWLDQQAKTNKMEGAAAPSISIVVPDAERGSAIADEAQGLAKAHSFERWVRIDLPKVHFDLPLLTNELLSYILYECEGDDQPQGDDQPHLTHRSAVLGDMWTMANGYSVYNKVSMIVAKVADVEKIEAEKSTKQAEDEIKSAVSSKEPMGVLLQALWLNKEGKLPSKQDLEKLSSFDKVLKKTAKMLKEHIEKEYKQGEKSTSAPIRLEDSQYEDILRNAYPKPASVSKPAEEGEGSSAASATTATQKEVTHNHKITLEIIRDLPPEPQPQPPPPLEQPTENIEQQAAKGDGKDQTNDGEPTQKSSPENRRTRLVIKGTVDMVTLDNIIGGGNEEGSNDPSAKKQASTASALGAEVASAIKGAKAILLSIGWPIKLQLMTKGIVDKIKGKLKKGTKTLIILQDEKDYVSRKWEETKKAFGLLGNSMAVIIFTTKNQTAKEYCHPPREPITYSLVGLYHDIVLQLTNLQQTHAENEEDGRNNSKILRDILDKCDPHVCCMKMFAHALYANPNRSREELQRLHDNLQHPKKSLATNAKKIFKFSYRDLPREHKTCLLYLAIFPQDHKISRSELIGRWLTEGLITKEDWPTAVRHAEQCFDGLVDRWLLCPINIGASGKVKSCMLGDPVHGFITKAAKKQHILDARLSHVWAHHFSIFSGLRLRASDSIDKFVKKLPTYSPQLPSLKLLDLQGCHCLEKNQRYLRDICSKIFLVKYLSLRGTNITHLPSEINNLHELEVLDIRQTRVPERDTRNIVLLKLRRLLAGHVDPNTCSRDKLVRDDDLFSYVRIPHKIEKMENMEVLSKVKASSKGSELKDIRKLWQLRKLGVVIDDNEDHLKNFLRAISDLKDCLQSLSIIIPETTSQGVNPKEILQQDIYNRLVQPPKLLESLSINGSTQRVKLLSVLAKGSNELAKVTLSRTLLKATNLPILAELPKLRCVRLRHNAYSGEELTFKQNDFMHLKYFLVEGTNIPSIAKSMTKTDIKFEDEAAPELEKIVLSFSNIRSVHGIGRLKKLKELELTCNKFLLSFSHDDAEAHKESSDSGSPNQNTQEGAPQQNTQNRDVEQNTQNIAAVQDTQNRAMTQSTENGAVVENTQSKTTTTENTESKSPEQDTKSRDMAQSTENGAVVENTQSKTIATENTESKAPDQDTKSGFIFKVKEFEHLKYFLLAEDSKITNISFQEGAAPKLEKIILSLTNDKSVITGVKNLSKLREIELKGGKCLLPSLLKGEQIAKVTLRDTQLKKDDLKDLATKPNLHCLVLSENSFDEDQISLDKHEFPKLELLIIDCSKINSVSFADGSAPNLEKIIWSFTEMKSLSGINHLPKLQELEFNGETVPRQVRREIIAHKGQPLVTHKKPPKEDKEDDDEERSLLFPCFSKTQNQAQ